MLIIAILLGQVGNTEPKGGSFMPGMEHVIVADFGSFISKTRERLIVKNNKQTVREIPFFDVEQLTVASKGVSLSADVVRACAEAGIPITFLSGSGKPYALLHSPNLTGTVITRREQYKALEDKRGLNWVKEVLKAKVHNQASMIKYAAKYRKGKDLALYTKQFLILRQAAQGSGGPGQFAAQLRLRHPLQPGSLCRYPVGA